MKKKLGYEAIVETKNAQFARVRDVHRMEKAKGYVEMIQKLLGEQGEARLTELAECCDASAVTVHKVIARLQKEKRIGTKPYRSLFLTLKRKKWRRQATNAIKQSVNSCANRGSRKRSPRSTLIA